MTIDHVDIWSNGTSTYDFVNGERPNEAAAWFAGFGAGSGSPTISLSAPGTVQEASVGAGVTVTETIITTNLMGNVYEEVLTSSGTVESGYKAVALVNGVATSLVFLAKSGDKIQVVDNPALPTVTADSPPVTITDPAPPTVTIGSGPDTLALQASEDAWNGNAQFTVSVDGTQIGGIQTATASHAAGQTQTFNVLGTFVTGTHTATVNFLNDAYGGSPATDRNLYVTGATIDNSVVPAAILSERTGGPQSFTFLTGSATSPVTIGSGPDTLALQVSEDAWNGNAQFTVSVDGTQIGGIQTATASHAAGQTQTFNVLGTFVTGTHTATVNFLNDAYGGSPATDRNLYVTGATIDNSVVPAAILSERTGGPQSFTFLTGSATSPVTIGSGPDTLALQVSEDAWNGNAQFTVSVDGTQIGGIRLQPLRMRRVRHRPSTCWEHSPPAAIARPLISLTMPMAVRRPPIATST